MTDVISLKVLYDFHIFFIVFKFNINCFYRSFFKFDDVFYTCAELLKRSSYFFYIFLMSRSDLFKKIDKSFEKLFIE